MFVQPFMFGYGHPPRRRRKKKPSSEPSYTFNDFLMEKFMKEYKEREQADKEKAKKDKEKKPDPPKINPLALATVLFLSMPIVGPAYVYFAVSMLKSSMELLPLK